MYGDVKFYFNLESKKFNYHFFRNKNQDYHEKDTFCRHENYNWIINAFVCGIFQEIPRSVFMNFLKIDLLI